jgi:arginine decarboxylase-like protein
MKHCMSTRVNLDDTSFKVLLMLLSWMDKLDKFKKDPQPQLLPAVLQWQIGKLPLNHYAEAIVYFSYVSRDVQNLLKSTAEFSPDDLIDLLNHLLPQVHYNISVSQGSNDKEDNSSIHDVLFFD